MSASSLCDIDAVLATLRPFLERLLHSFAHHECPNPDSVEQLEQDLQDWSQRLGAHLFAEVLAHLLDPDTSDFDRMATRAFQDHHNPSYKNAGRRLVTVHFPDGSTRALKVTYLRPRKRRRRGPSKRCGHRGEAGKGRFPALEALGIHNVHCNLKCTPVTFHRITWALSASDSGGAASKLLEKWGLSLTTQQLHHFTRRAGKTMRAQRQRWFESGGAGPLDPDEFEGRTVTISVDGGSCRLRQNKPGRPRSSGYHGYHTPWKEPRLLTMYVVDEQGHKEREIRPVLDGLLVEEPEEDEVAADRFIRLVKGYVEALELEKAARVCVVADGADWIWKRMRPMLEEQGVEPERIVEVVDMYHTRQTVHRLAAGQPWAAGKQVNWREEVLEVLEKESWERLEELLCELVAPGKEEATPGYLRKHKKRMCYARFEEQGVPRGSGVIESAVRRVINMRLKGSGRFWGEENACTMLMWRSYLKSGRLEELCAWSRRQHAHWWTRCDQHRTHQVLLDAA